MPAQIAATGLYNQTLHYGNGVFEGIRSYKTGNGFSVFKSREHYERLKYSASSMGLNLTYSVNEMMGITHQLLKENNLSDAYIRPLVFGGECMSLETKPNNVQLFIAAWEWGKLYGENLTKLYLSNIKRPNPDAFDLKAKVNGHYVNSIRALWEAKANGYDESLLLDSNGFIAECSGSNIFMEKNGTLYTPHTTYILPGITRKTVFEICANLSIKVAERNISIDEFYNADAAFLTGTAAEVAGVESLNGKPFALNFNQSLGKKIQEAYQQMVRMETKKAQLC